MDAAEEKSKSRIRIRSRIRKLVALPYFLRGLLLNSVSAVTGASIDETVAKYLVILLEERPLAESGLRQAADFLDGLLEVKLERHELN